MHLGYLEEMRKNTFSPERREFFRKTSGALATGLAASVSADDMSPVGFQGSGRMGMSTGEDWIDTFFNGGAEAIVHYYADNFVFEDVTLFQTIDTKEDLYRAFLPFGNSGPDSPAGVHQFDVIRYDGGKAGDRRGVQREKTPENYTPELWQMWSSDTLAGVEHDYDEWAVMNWVWKAKHNMDFLELPAKGKETHTRGMTFHLYNQRKVVREYTYWNFRDVAIQLGAFQPQQQFWKAPPAS